MPIGFGHGQDQPVAFYGGGDGEADAGVAAGRLDDQRAGLQHAALFGILDHRNADPVLHAGAGIAGFHLDEDFGAAAVESVDPDEGGMPDQFKYVIEYFFHNAAPVE